MPTRAGGGGRGDAGALGDSAGWGKARDGDRRPEAGKGGDGRRKAAGAVISNGNGPGGGRAYFQVMSDSE